MTKRPKGGKVKIQTTEIKLRHNKTKVNKIQSLLFTKDFYGELHKNVLKNSYYEFFKWSFKLLHPSDPFSDAPHIKELCDVLEEEIFRIIKRKRKTKDIIINIPPRTSKSLIVSVMLLPWAWIHMPSLKMISISYDESLVITNSRMCRDILKHKDYLNYFGDIFQLRTDSDSVAHFLNDKGGSRLSKTTGSSIVGHGAHLIVVDDPQSDSTARSETKRAEIHNYYSKNLYNRLTPAQLGVRIVIQQRLHEKDLTGVLLEKKPKSYIHFNLPATVTEKTFDRVKPERLKYMYKWDNGVGYLDPIRLDKKTIEDYKVELGTYGYTAQYDQDPQSEEGGIIKREWFKIVNPNDVVRDRQKEPIHFFLDTAYEEKKSSDPSAIMAAFRRGNEIYIVRSESKKLEFPELCKYLVKFVNEYGYSGESIIWVEPKASGKSLVQQIKATTMLNIVEGEPPKDDKISRLAAVSPITESRRVNLIQGGWNEDFLNQVCSASEEKLPEHDDEIDTFCMAVRKLLITGQFDFMFLNT